MTDKELKESKEKYYDSFIEKLRREAMWHRLAIEEKKERERKEEVYKKIQAECEFTKKLVKKSQSRQTGERAVFYDIELTKFPSTKIYDSKTYNEYNKWNKLRGRSFNISMYASYKQSLEHQSYILFYLIPGIEWAYEQYLQENFYGKEIEYEDYPGCYLKCKAYQIDWFDEVYLYDKKIPTTFQKWIEEYKDQQNKIWKDRCNYNPPEPESWEKAWIDSVIYTRTELHRFCEDLLKDPELYSGIKDYKEYIREANKIFGHKYYNI